MKRYLIKRTITMAVTFFGITIVVFAILRFAPGDPTQQKIDFGQREKDSGRAQQLIRFKQAYNLDKPRFLNLRPYRDYRPEMKFWLDFLTWHVPYRARYLSDAKGERKKKLLRYFKRIKLPAAETALNGSSFEVRQAAKNAIRETLLLNLADRDVWMVPIVAWELIDVSKTFRTISNPIETFQNKLSSLRNQSVNGEAENGPRRQLAEQIQELEETIGEVTVSPSMTHLDDTATIRSNILILRAWLVLNKESGNASSKKVKDATSLLKFLTSSMDRLRNDELSQTRKNTLRQEMKTRINDVLRRYDTFRVSGNSLTLNPDRSIRYNRAVAGLHMHRVRRRLDVVVRFLNVLTGDAFGVTFRMPDRRLSEAKREELEQQARNVSFLWVQGWWRNNKDRFEPISSDRRAKLEEIMNELLSEKNDFDRRRMIRVRIRKRDLPFMIEQLRNTDAPLARRAVASQVLIEFANAPRYYEMTARSSRKHIEQTIQLWRRWWEQNRRKYTFSTLDRLWHTVSQTQYSLYMWNLLHLNFGDTMSDPVEPVYDRLKRAIWRTGPLMLMSTIFTYLMAIPIGVICAVTQRTVTDRGISVSLLVLWAIPGYAAAMILIFLFANPGDGGLMQMFPDRGLARYDEILWHLFYAFSGGAEQSLGFWGHLQSFASGTVDYVYHAFLPMFSTSVFGMASLALYSRVSMLEVIRKDYIRSARAKGLPEFLVIGKHVVRNGLNPIITLFANLLPRIVSGSLIIEIIFEIQGVGKMFFEAAQARDYNVMMCFLLISAILVMVGILISDLLYVVANPRLDFEEAQT